MEPKSPTPQFNPEQFPSVATGVEQDATHFARPEAVGESSRAERVQERPAQQTAPSPVMPALPAIPAPAAPSASGTAAPADDNPLLASDEDLIEREWVDRAKKIIAATRDDPYRREVEIAKLQIDYLKKRYGKDLGAVS